jgi:hypothetical protein
MHDDNDSVSKFLSACMFLEEETNRRRKVALIDCYNNHRMAFP